MAAALVPVDRFESGDLPAICPRHGLPATGQYPQSVTPSPSLLLALWMAVSVFTGGTGAAIRHARERDIDGRLPMCARCEHVRRTILVLRIALWVALAATLYPAVIHAERSAYVIAWFVAMVVVPIVHVTAPDRWMVMPTVTKDHQLLRIKRASRVFVAALEANSSTRSPA